MELDITGLQMPNTPEQPRVGQIVLRPLERGFGHTLGNTIRRILLSSLRGSAVWAFRADGVLHEHQTVPGVVEDVHEIIRNLKSLVLRMDEGADEAVLELRANKAGRVTARNITGHPSVDVINLDHHILELQDDRDLRFELYVNKGRGYVPAEAHPIPRGMPADLVRVDAIYNPVTRANFVVEETRVGQRTDFDRLVLEVETNGAIDVPSAGASSRCWRSTTSARSRSRRSATSWRATACASAARWSRTTRARSGGWFATRPTTTSRSGAPTPAPPGSCRGR